MNRSKKIWFFAAAAIAAAVFLAALQKDLLSSFFLSRMLGLNISVVGARLSFQREILFDRMLISLPADQKVVVVSASGKIRAGLRHIDIDAKDVEWDVSSFSILRSATLPAEFFKNGRLHIERIRVVIQKEDQDTLIRLMECVSNGFSANGGGRFENGKLVGGNLTITVPSAVWRRLPENISRRMQKAGSDRRSLRILLKGNVLTLESSGVPFFQAQWQ